MSAKYDKVLDLKVVTDHDCGNYTIGDIECFGAYGGEIRAFLQHYGEEGRDKLLHALTFCIHRVHQENTLLSTEAMQAAKYFAGTEVKTNE